MPPTRKATPGKPRALASLELDHPGPAWTEGDGTGRQRRTPAKAPAEPGKWPAKPAKSPARAKTPPPPPARAKPPPTPPLRSETDDTPVKEPKMSPATARRVVAKPIPAGHAETARKQLAEDSLGDYWKSSAGSRRKSRGDEAKPPARAASPSPARPGEEPQAYGYEDDEPITQIGGGWFVNKVLLTVAISLLASLITQLSLKRTVCPKVTFVFASWGLLQGTASTLWGKLLGWATESWEVGLRRTVATILIDQLVMNVGMAAVFIAYVSAVKVNGALASAELRANLGLYWVEVVAFGLLAWVGAYMINLNVPRKKINLNVPHTKVLIFCRLEQLAHAVYLATVASKLMA
mmetsp:Transcript_8051/g.18985  ORF Transcript_8051/g.18985 Transcript_8051/m.18985 type:complete len:350 (-) Transcript_8051:384-1433(-)